MRVPSLYERYLTEEIHKYWFQSEKMPDWLRSEWNTYRWITRLGDRIYRPLEYGTVSKQLLESISHIPTIRFRRYRDISPTLKMAIDTIAKEFSIFNEELKNPDMWEIPYLLSDTGFERWRAIAKLVSSYRDITPDLEWWSERKRNDDATNK